jgi:hypothetical protein
MSLAVYLAYVAAYILITMSARRIRLIANKRIVPDRRRRVAGVYARTLKYCPWR